MSSDEYMLKHRTGTASKKERLMETLGILHGQASEGRTMVLDRSHDQEITT